MHNTSNHERSIFEYARQFNRVHTDQETAKNESIAELYLSMLQLHHNPALRKKVKALGTAITIQESARDVPWWEVERYELPAQAKNESHGRCGCHNDATSDQTLLYTEKGFVYALRLPGSEIQVPLCARQIPDPILRKGDQDELQFGTFEQNRIGERTIADLFPKLTLEKIKKRLEERLGRAELLNTTQQSDETCEFYTSIIRLQYNKELHNAVAKLQSPILITQYRRELTASERKKAKMVEKEPGKIKFGETVRQTLYFTETGFRGEYGSTKWTTTPLLCINAKGERLEFGIFASGWVPSAPLRTMFPNLNYAEVEEKIYSALNDAKRVQDDMQ
jgi:hypothetical protein